MQQDHLDLLVHPVVLRVPRDQWDHQELLELKVMLELLDQSDLKVLLVLKVQLVLKA